MRLTRRRVLMGMSGFALARPVSVLGVWPSFAKASDGFSRSEWTADKSATLNAAVERLLPGAVDAGVPVYIAHWLGFPAFRGLGGYIATGLEWLDRLAEKRGHASFANSPLKAQDDILFRLAKGEANLKAFDGRMFFRKLMELTLEGFLCDPKYGGNRDRAGWKLIGMPEGPHACWWSPSGVTDALGLDDGFTD